MERFGHLLATTVFTLLLAPSSFADPARNLSKSEMFPSEAKLPLSNLDMNMLEMCERYDRNKRFTSGKAHFYLLSGNRFFGSGIPCWGDQAPDSYELWMSFECIEEAPPPDAAKPTLVYLPVGGIPEPWKYDFERGGGIFVFRAPVKILNRKKGHFEAELPDASTAVYQSGVLTELMTAYFHRARFLRGEIQIKNDDSVAQIALKAGDYSDYATTITLLDEQRRKTQEWSGVSHGRLYGKRLQAVTGVYK